MPNRRNFFVVKLWRLALGLMCSAVWFGAGPVAGDSGWVARTTPPRPTRSRIAWPAGAQPTALAPLPGSVPANTGSSSSQDSNYGPVLLPEANYGPVPTTVVPLQAAPFAGPIGNGNDYWLVSSRKCKRRDRDTGTSCCLHFFHSPQDNQILPVERQAFMGAINPAVPVCFVIHGSYNRWGDVTKESRRIHRWIRSGCGGAPVQVVFFTWPSDGNLPFIFPIDIAMLGRRSSLHALYLAQLIAEFPSEVRVSMVGHSHGARVAVSALHLLGGGHIEDGRRLAGPAVPHRMRATLLAPAVDHHWLNPGERYGQALCVTERMLLMRNQSDATMAMYVLRKPFAEQALGYRGPSHFDRMLLDGQNEKLVEMDVSDSVRMSHAWASYCRRPELAAAVAPFACFCDDGQFQSNETYAPQTIRLGPTPVESPSARPTPAEPTPLQPAPVEPRKVLSGPARKPQRFQLPLRNPTAEAALPPAPKPTARTAPPATGRVRIEPTYVTPLPSGTTRLPATDLLPEAPPPTPGQSPIRIELDEGNAPTTDQLPVLVDE